MNYLSQYELPFQSIKNGQESFELKIDDKFFDYFEQQLIKGGNLDVTLVITRDSNDFLLNFSITGTVIIQCDICLDWYNHELTISETINAKFGASTEFDTLEDYIILGKDDNQINISLLLNELIVLSLPMKHEHPRDANGKRTCNKNMLKILEGLKLKGEQIDPRWEVLNELKNKENGTS
ncbi:MAG TPA: DUF177 domain-containing protein [Bacteroidales bacterium]|nr:DUF177 domain-containing protein [Bacteroidales bacterium]MDD4234551.1 DUF177 domain-containing protein [Bacteroidales bacterium]MDY0159768.1 DUF177 domain-containing protein [Bacteroidales bacterium]HXK80573.1 DUF177 domain-containing protein [Bacteroidales bacterium]